jgi:hypothetical protein
MTVKIGKRIEYKIKKTVEIFFYLKICLLIWIVYQEISVGKNEK